MKGIALATCLALTGCASMQVRTTAPDVSTTGAGDDVKGIEIVLGAAVVGLGTCTLECSSPWNYVSGGGLLLAGSLLVGAVIVDAIVHPFRH